MAFDRAYVFIGKEGRLFGWDRLTRLDIDKRFRNLPCLFLSYGLSLSVNGLLCGNDSLWHEHLELLWLEYVLDALPLLLESLVLSSCACDAYLVSYHVDTNSFLA